jgi:CRISPR-associated protein Cas4
LRTANEKVIQNNLFGEGEKALKPDLKFLTQLYEKHWIDEWYESKKQKEEYFSLGKKIAKNFYEQYEKNQPEVLKVNGSLALELPFNLKVGDYTLFGVIDRIDEDKDGVTIIDYKTGQAKEKLDFDAKEQLLIYQIAVQELLHLKPKQLSYYYLEEGKYASFLGTEKEIETQKGKIVEEIEKIKNSEFEPTPGWQCQYCDFKDICDHAQK